MVSSFIRRFKQFPPLLRPSSLSYFRPRPHQLARRHIRPFFHRQRPIVQRVAFRRTFNWKTCVNQCHPPPAHHPPPDANPPSDSATGSSYSPAPTTSTTFSFRLASKSLMPTSTSSSKRKRSISATPTALLLYAPTPTPTPWSRRKKKTMCFSYHWATRLWSLGTTIPATIPSGTPSLTSPRLPGR